MSTHPLLFSTFITSILYCFSVSYKFRFCWQSRQEWQEVIVPYIVWEGTVTLREELSGGLLLVNLSVFLWDRALKNSEEHLRKKPGDKVAQ